MNSILSATVLIPLIVIVLLIVLLCVGYVKAPPDMAYIISGVKKKSKVVIGKASIRIPFFERLDKLNLRLIPIDVKTSNAVPTADYININVDATVNVKISNNPEKLRLAAENFLNKNTEYIAGVAREVLEGNVREIVGKMKLEEMVSDRQKFANLVKENAEPDLAAMGLDIISFNVQNFVDGNEVIENLGIDNIVKIKKSAAIARAESERDIKVAQAAADKESNDAAVAAQTEIAKKQNELAIKKSELQMEADTKKAMADAAYEIQKEEQRKTIEVTTANADIAKQEREIELKQKEVAVKEQSLEAEIKKQAEADKYAAQQRAEAELYQRQKDAEARQFEAQREAEMIKVLPDIAAKVAEPLGQIDKITIIGGGEGGNGVDQVAGNVPVVMAKVFESMKEATGIDLADIINAESYDAQVNRNINVSGLDSVNLVVKDEKKAAEQPDAPTRAFLLTSDWQLYYVHFAARDYGPAPVTKAGEIVHNYKVLSEEKKGRKWRREYLGSEEFRSMVQQYLEGVRTDTMGCVIEHLQTPSIRSEGIDGSVLRYWDDARKKWATIRLLRTNTGYEKICRTVKLRQELGR